MAIRLQVGITIFLPWKRERGHPDILLIGQAIAVTVSDVFAYCYTQVPWDGP